MQDISLKNIWHAAIFSWNYILRSRQGGLKIDTQLSELWWRDVKNEIRTSFTVYGPTSQISGEFGTPPYS